MPIFVMVGYKLLIRLPPEANKDIINTGTVALPPTSDGTHYPLKNCSLIPQSH